MRTSLAAIVALVLIIPAAAETQSWNIDGAHSSAQFSVRHMGISTVRGAFTKLSGTVQYDATNPAKTTIDATIEAASVDTRVDLRDNDLRGPNFFDASKYPTLTFKSKKVEEAGPGKLRVTGDLTIHGVTKRVTIDVSYQLVSATEIRILGTVPIVWADYKIPSPTFAGVADVRDNGAMEFLIVATR